MAVFTSASGLADNSTMKHFKRLACGLLLLGLVAAGMVGCGPRALTAAESTAVKKQQYEDGRHFWRNRLVPESEIQVIGPIPVGDRQVTLKARALTMYSPGSVTSARMPSVDYANVKIEPTAGSFYELVDSDTNKVILPLDYWDIMPIPGVGVFVRKPTERIKGIKAKHNAGELPKWRKLDLATGEMPETDVLFAESYVMPPAAWDEPASPDPTKWVSVLGRHDPASTSERPLTQLEVYPIYEAGKLPVTDPLVYGRVLGKPSHKLLTAVGKFTRLAGVDENEKSLTLLLDEQLRYVLETDQPVRRMRGWGNDKSATLNGRSVVSFLATPAPGTMPADDLWIFLDEHGRFGAPEYVVGYRPLYKEKQTADGVPPRGRPLLDVAERWLMRLRTDATTPYTPQVNGSKSINARWMLVDGDLKPLAYSVHLWDYQIAYVPWIDRSVDNTTGVMNQYSDGRQYERLFMACVQWEGWTIVDPLSSVKKDRTFANAYATIAEPAQLVPRLTEMHQREIAVRAKQKQIQDAYIAQKAKEALEKRRESIEVGWRYYLTDGNYAWCASVADERGGDSWYELVRAMDRPTVEFLNRAMSRARTDEQKTDIQRMIGLAEARASSEQQARWARQKEDERLRWLARNPPDPVTYSSSGSDNRSSIGGGMTSGWKVSDSQKQAYMKSLSTSQHKTNMGWSNPYAY